VESFLAACSGIRNLFAQFNLYGDMHLLGILQDVQVLVIDVEAISERAAVDVPHPLFLNVAHLELLDINDISVWNAADVYAHLASIPRLVALNMILNDIVSHTDLRDGTRLECIVFLLSLADKMDTSPLFGDVRFVFIRQKDDYRLYWLRGATTGNDCWAHADAFIAARRAGNISVVRSSYFRLILISFSSLFALIFIFIF
jgi:hypothetical protein